jgi:CheY-like chemotaxis protein
MSDSENGRGDILIVDDNPVNLDLLSGMLHDHNYRVRVATNGRRALQAARSCLPDLIMLDINMPEMDGYEVCRQLKADRSLHSVPVIFISALDETMDKVKAFKVGGVDYVAKPFQFERGTGKNRESVKDLQATTRDGEEELRTCKKERRTTAISRRTYQILRKG